MPPQVTRRGSIALSMLDNQSIAPRLESVLSSVSPPSEEAALQVVDEMLTEAIWRSHIVTLDEVAISRAAQKTALGLVRLMGMTQEFLPRDKGEPETEETTQENGEPEPGEIDLWARGRVASHRKNVIRPADVDSLSDDTSDDFSLASSSGPMSIKRVESSTSERNAHEGGNGGGQSKPPAKLPLTQALSIRKAGGVNRGGSLHRLGSGMVTARSEGPGTSRSFASSAKCLVNPAMGRLFDTADRRKVGWLNVTDLQAFLEYHGHKQWANPNFIKSTLTDLGILRGGNEPIKQIHFLRFIFFLMQKDPLMEFSARPLPPDQLSLGVPEQARELAVILKEVASRFNDKPVAARRRLSRALASQSLIQLNTTVPAHAPAGEGAGEATGTRVGTGTRPRQGDGGGDAVDLANGWENQRWSHQLSPQVSVRDPVVTPRPSTVPPGAAAGGSYRKRVNKAGKRGGAGDDTRGGGGGGGIKKEGLTDFVALDYTVQASLVETMSDVRPGVTVQEVGFPPDTAAADGPAGTGAGPGYGSGNAEVIVRMKAGPAELQVPGRLSRSAYKALSRSRTAAVIPPMGFDRPLAEMHESGEGARGGTAIGRNGMSHPALKACTDGVHGGIRASTAPLGLHGFFGEQDGPDPRFLGGSKVPTGFNGDGGDNGSNVDAPNETSATGLHEKRPRKLGGSAARGGELAAHLDDSLWPIFVGEDIGSSSIGGAAKGKEPHVLLPRGGRQMSPATEAIRARASSPGLGVRDAKRGGRSVAAW